MSDLTVNEKMNSAAARAREIAAEKHHYDKNQPFHPDSFSVIYRNKGHYDIIAQECPGKVTAWLEAHGPGSSTTAKDGDRERAFRIRGEPGKVLVADERWNPHKPNRDRNWLEFGSVLAAMVYITDQLLEKTA